MRRRPPVSERVSAEEIVWVGLWPATLVMLASLLWLAPPLADLYPDPTYRFYTPFLSSVKPEPVEAVRVGLALVVPLGLAGLALIGSAAPARRRFDPAIILLQIAVIGVIVLGVVEQVDGPYFFYPPDYFRPRLLGIPVLVGGSLIGAALTAMALHRGESLRRLVRLRLAHDRSRALLGVAVTTTALWLAPAILTDDLLAGSGVIPSGSVLAQGEDYFAVVNGLTPSVDYVSQYANFLPLLVAPALDALGLSTTSFTLLMTGLSLFALVAVYGVLSEVTGRAWPALLIYIPFLALALFPWTDQGLTREFNGNYFAVLPGRYLGPFLVAWLCARAVRRHRPPTWLLGFAAGVTVLNNAEFGIPCALALLAALFLGSDREKPLRARARAVLVPTAAGFAAAAGLVCLIVLVRTGEFPDPRLLTYYTTVFARQGFGLEPMPTLGLHIALYVTYVAALLVAAVRRVSADADRTTTAMLAYAGVFGLLTTEYFAGRSLPWQLMLLFPPWAMTLGLLTWISAQHLIAIGDDPGRSRRTILPTLSAMVGYGVMIAAIPPFRFHGGRSNDSRSKASHQRSYVRLRTSSSAQLSLARQSCCLGHQLTTGWRRQMESPTSRLGTAWFRSSRPASSLAPWMRLTHVTVER